MQNVRPNARALPLRAEVLLRGQRLGTVRVLGVVAAGVVARGRRWTTASVSAPPSLSRHLPRSLQQKPHLRALQRMACRNPDAPTLCRRLAKAGRT